MRLRTPVSGRKTVLCFFFRTLVYEFAHQNLFFSGKKNTAVPTMVARCLVVTRGQNEQSGHRGLYSKRTTVATRVHIVHSA